MKSRKPRKLAEETRDATPPERTAAPAPEAPGFLVRLVGKSRAKTLCRAGTVQPRRD